MIKHNRELLGIQYIHGRLSAQVLLQAKSLRQWEYPMPVIEEGELAEILVTIPKELNFQGRKVSMILLTPSTDFSAYEVPPMGKKDLEQYLKMRVQSLENKNHIWCYTKTPLSDNRFNIYLHLVPAIYRTIFLEFCEKLNYEPFHLLTMASVVPYLLKEKNGNSNDLGLIGVECGEKTFLVVGQKNVPYLMREVPYSWVYADPTVIDRLSIELKRTSMFIQQHLNDSIKTMYLLGRGAKNLKDALAELEEVDIEIDQTDINWLEHLHAIPKKQSENLIPLSIIGQTNRSLRVKVTALMLILALIVSVSTALFVNSLAQNLENRHNWQEIERIKSDLLHEKAELNHKRSVLVSQTNLYSSIELSSQNPIPVRFVRAAAALLPEQLVLTRLAITNGEQAHSWNVEIEGIGPYEATSIAEILDQYQEQLVNKISSFSISVPWKVQWITRMRRGTTRKEENKVTGFHIAGILQ